MAIAPVEIAQAINREKYKNVGLKRFELLIDGSLRLIVRIDPGEH